VTTRSNEVRGGRFFTRFRDSVLFATADKEKNANAPLFFLARKKAVRLNEIRYRLDYNKRGTIKKFIIAGVRGQIWGAAGQHKKPNLLDTIVFGAFTDTNVDTPDCHFSIWLLAVDRCINYILNCSAGCGRTLDFAYPFATIKTDSQMSIALLLMLLIILKNVQKRLYRVVINDSYFVVGCGICYSTYSM
jgi:hypothetical protein